ncbi:MAG TPA: patatin-like phospholipase family protein, partial [Acidimicrobiales bacterium]|nr:patatin-like phospholipase family protein [Acidimicrobiales bacterium]
GGVVGRAYLVGTLAGLADGLGWDARDADLIVGTSAGSGTGATLRAGLSPADFLARLTAGELSAEGRELLGQLPPAPDLPLRPPVSNRWWRPQAPQLLVRAFTPPWQPRLGLAFAGLLPRGAIPTDELGERIAMLHDRPWPDDPLWICAVRLRDGRRTVFGRDEPTADLDLAIAVQASSAIPGYFTPVRVHGEDHVDGGAHSPTNADLVAGLGYDVVVAVSPMSAERSALRPDPGSVPRAFCHWYLDRELDAVRRTGSTTVAFEPTAADLRHMRGSALSYEHESDIVFQARQSVLRRIERSGARSLTELA